MSSHLFEKVSRLDRKDREQTEFRMMTHDGVVRRASRAAVLTVRGELGRIELEIHGAAHCAVTFNPWDRKLRARLVKALLAHVDELDEKDGTA
jgi:hypothetical protein